MTSKFFLNLVVILFVTLNSSAQTKTSKTDGLNDTAYFKLPKKFVDKPLLVINRITGYPNKLFYYGSSGMDVDYSVIVKFEIDNNQLKVTQQQYQNNVDKDDVIKTSVRKNHFNPTICYIPILSIGEKTIKINTDVFKNDIKVFSPIDDETIDKYGLEPLSNNSIVIGNIRLSKNSLLVSRTLNFTSQKSPEKHYSPNISVEQLLAFRILPENPMVRRKWDPRVGNFYLSTTKYDSDNVFIKEESFIERWALEPENKADYFNGILTKPKQPIVFYFDENVPQKWKKYVKQGILNWLPVFEKIGFKDAIEVHDKPKNAKWDNYDPNYNMIRWVSSEIKDAQGNYISDPRTGEILNGTLTLYQNYFTAINDDYFVATAAVNPVVRQAVLPDSIFGELLRSTMTHEMGHALNLGHNMIASSAYPTDSLRSSHFVQKNSFSASIMDYANYNYVAQPEDMPIPLYSEIGPYDYWAIEYAYKYTRPLNDKSKMESVYPNEEMDKYLQDEKRQYMEQEYGIRMDPTNNTGDLGDNPILSGEYGLKNLKRVMPHIVEWSLPEDADPSILLSRYDEVIKQVDLYFSKVIKLIGGKKNRLTSGMEYVTEPIDDQTTMDAMNFIARNAFTKMDWLYNPEIEKFSEENLYVNGVEKIQTDGIKRILNKDRLLRLIDYDTKNNTETTTRILRKMSDVLLVESTFENIPLNVQKAYLDRVNELIEQTTDTPILNYVLKGELDYIHKAITTKTQKEDNPLVKGFYTNFIK
ncbi:zinc-dependent metalloprotease [Maribacter cobaltidurans]|nr:zinc-dependent metalloprotease [Maribacter cobaltidurans]